MPPRKAVQLLIPCLVDQLYPEVGVATANILTHFGYEVRYSQAIVCCGQPAFNAGHRDEAKKVAAVCLAELERDKECFAIVCPSGSCTAMVKNFYGTLFEEPEKSAAVRAITDRTFELSDFLMRQGHTAPSAPERTGEPGGKARGRGKKKKQRAGDASIPGSWMEADRAIETVADNRGDIGFHNSCHSYRELRLKSEGREVLATLGRCSVKEPTDEPVCCGFGGLFSIKFASIASGMAKSRLESFVNAGMSQIVSNDPGCIMHLRSEAERHNIPVEVVHSAIPIARALGLPVDSFTKQS